MYSNHNKRKSVVAERFVRTLRNKIHKYITSISKDLYIDKLDDIVSNYNNTYHKTIKMKHVGVKPSIHIDSSKDFNDKYRKFKIDDTVRISTYKNIFARGYVPDLSEEAFAIEKVKNTVPWTYVISDVKDFRVKKVIKKKGNKLHVKWKGYDSSFNSCIDKKDIV